jgi:hypothetical protein
MSEHTPVDNDDVNSLHALLEEFDVGFNDLAAPTDSAMRMAVRKIAEHAGGLSEGGLAVTMASAEPFSEKAWRRLAQYSRTAVNAGESLFALRLGRFALVWDHIAENQGIGDVLDMGLMKPPKDALVAILSQGVLAAPDVRDDLIVAHDGGGVPLSARATGRHLAWVLLRLEREGASVDPVAKSAAARLGA